MKAAVPFEAALMLTLLARLRAENVASDTAPRHVHEVSHAGDDGGIL